MLPLSSYGAWLGTAGIALTNTRAYTPPAGTGAFQTGQEIDSGSPRGPQKAPCARKPLVDVSERVGLSDKAVRRSDALAGGVIERGGSLPVRLLEDRDLRVDPHP